MALAVAQAEVFEESDSVRGAYGAMIEQVSVDENCKGAQLI